MSEHSSTSLLKRIQTARITHAQLRSQPPTRDALDSKRLRYESLRALFDDLSTTIEQASDRHTAKLLRSATRKLAVDAEWFAGIQAEVEGFRDANDVSAQYDLLESHFTPDASDDAGD